jgi:hypothetical protein
MQSSARLRQERHPFLSIAQWRQDLVTPLWLARLLPAQCLRPAKQGCALDDGRQIVDQLAVGNAPRWLGAAAAYIVECPGQHLLRTVVYSISTIARCQR